jgi:hypothetical protein
VIVNQRKPVPSGGNGDLAAGTLNFNGLTRWAAIIWPLCRCPTRPPDAAQPVRTTIQPPQGRSRASPAPCLLAALCCLLGSAVVGAILQQRPDVYGLGIALLANGCGLVRRLNWARILSVAGLAVVAAGALLAALRHPGDPLSLSVIVAAIFLAARLWQHPEDFTRRWW